MPTTAHTSTGGDWDTVRGRLASSFPEFGEQDILAELLHAHEAVQYVGAPDHEQLELVEFMARYGLLVRAGRVSPSDRLDPERHASPKRGERAAS
jgi:hypothetical protein